MFSGPEPYVLATFEEDGIRESIAISQPVLVKLISIATLSVLSITRISSSRRTTRNKSHVITDGGTSPDHENWYSHRGVRIRIDRTSLEATVTVDVRQGASVPKVAAQVRTEFGLVVEKMRGLRTKSVAIHVNGFDPEFLAE